jgi:hypothetical protein
MSMEKKSHLPSISNVSPVGIPDTISTNVNAYLSPVGSLTNLLTDISSQHLPLPEKAHVPKVDKEKEISQMLAKNKPKLGEMSNSKLFAVGKDKKSPQNDTMKLS